MRPQLPPLLAADTRGTERLRAAVELDNLLTSYRSMGTPIRRPRAPEVRDGLASASVRIQTLLPGYLATALLSLATSRSQHVNIRLPSQRKFPSHSMTRSADSQEPLGSSSSDGSTPRNRGLIERNCNEPNGLCLS